MGIYKKNGGRYTNIETLRGFAILLVVMGHVIGSSSDGGMRLEYPSPYRYIYLWIDYIQMPLFTAISGWVYALKPIYERDQISTFFKKKVIRLLIPMVVVGTLYFMVQYLVPGTNRKGELSEIWRIYIFPYTIYWYLPSLFLIFLTYMYFDLHWGKRKVLSQWLFFLFIALMFRNLEVYLGAFPNFFSFRGALRLLPYFVLGVGMKCYADKLYSSFLKKLYIVLFLCSGVMLQMKWHGIVNLQIYDMFVEPFGVMACVLLLQSLNYSNRILTWIGGYAYAIYLFHGFFTSGGRIVMHALGVQETIGIFLFSTIIAVGASILIEQCAKRSKIAGLLFLGQIVK